MPEPGYITDPIEIDAEQLEEDAYDDLEELFPGWEPSDAQLAVAIIRAVARMCAEVAVVSSAVPEAIFKFMGESLFGVPQIVDQAATTTALWEIVDSDGYIVEAGTLVAIESAEGEIFAFEVAGEVEIPNGSSTTTGYEVTLTAVEPGAAANGLGGTGVSVELITPDVRVLDVRLGAATGGGADEETDSEYLDNFSEYLTIISPTPIIPRDFETFARYTASRNGVKIRCLALDGYKPADNTWNNEKIVSLAAIDEESGANISGGLKTIIDTAVQAAREANFEFYMIDPTRSDVDVTYTVKALPGVDTAALEATIDEALTEYLSPANWGQPPSGSDRRWIRDTNVRRMEIGTIINNVEGVDYVSALTIGINGGAQNTNETNAITGAAPLVEPGVISGTVDA